MAKAELIIDTKITFGMHLARYICRRPKLFWLKEPFRNLPILKYRISDQKWQKVKFGEIV